MVNCVFLKLFNILIPYSFVFLYNVHLFFPDLQIELIIIHIKHVQNIYKSIITVGPLMDTYYQYT